MKSNELEILLLEFAKAAHLTMRQIEIELGIRYKEEEELEILKRLDESLISKKEKSEASGR